MSDAYRIGIDVGGTFTDLVAVDDAGHLNHAKAASTPADPSLGVMAGLERLARDLRLDLGELLARTQRIVHGTTVATNALIEGKGAKVGLLTTEGHRDILEMREGLKDDRYDLRQPPPVPLVPRQLRLGVRERLRADGTVLTELDRASLAAGIEQLRDAGVEAVAVGYLHAWRNDAHEQATAAAVRAALPEVHLSLSAEVLPEIKEFERFGTTVVNAYVGPALQRYLERLARRLHEAGYGGPVLIVQSHGGVATIPQAVRLAAGAVLSGPAGGVAGSRQAARLCGVDRLIPFDMGGTSTDVSLIIGGEAAIATGRVLAGQRLGLPSLDIVSIGAGGGSIARVDAGGILHVGPQSAGADPGPACYGRGGHLPTVTDADLVLGYLDPATFLGGEARLDVEAANSAVASIGQALGIEPVQAAAGMHRIVNTHMAEGIRLVSVRRGVDPRGFVILAFGGAAGLHVTAVARELEIGRVILPRLAAVLSAWGMLTSDLRAEFARTDLTETSRLDPLALGTAFAAMEAAGRRYLAEAGFDGAIEIERSVDMRYGEQVFEVRVPLAGMDLGAPDLTARLAEAFHARHETLYTYALRDREPVLVHARLAAVGRLASLPEEAPLPTRAPAPPSAMRRLWLDGWLEVPVFAIDALASGQAIDGPAILESATTTVLLRVQDRAVATPLGWLDIHVGENR